MGNVVSGLLGGGTGNSYQAQSAQIQTPTTNAQALNTYNQSQAALANQNAFAQAVQAQNGLQNQSNVYNQLQGVANGTGPNPAQAQLAQATGQNVSNQAALMAGQRGSGANAGLIARQAAMQGANTQQAAAGQAATLQANQSLNALNSMGTLATNQANLAQTATNANAQNFLTGQSNILNGIQSQNNAAVGNQGNINSNNATIANTVAGQQGNLLGSAAGAVGGAGQLIGGIGSGSSPITDIGQAGSVDSSASGFGDIAGGAGDAGSSLGDISALAANGGMIGSPSMPKMASGGPVDLSQLDPTGATPAAPQVATDTQVTDNSTLPSALSTDGTSQSGPQSNVGKFLANSGPTTTSAAAPKAGGSSASGGLSSALGMAGDANMVGQFFGGDSATPIGQAGQWFGNLFSDVGSGAASLGEGVAGAPGALAGGAGDAVSGIGEGVAATAPEVVAAAPEVGEGVAVAAAAKGGKAHKKVPALVSPGERYLSPSEVTKVAQGKANPMKAGEKIPGKPKVGGAKNSYANDTVPKTLEKGGIVLPRSVTQAKHPAWEAHKFVSAIMAKNGKLK